MTIVCDATALYGRFGGIETALFQTLKHLGALDAVNRYVLCVPRDCPLEANLFPAHWTLHRLSFGGRQKLRRIAWQQLQLPSLASKLGAQIVYCPTYVAPIVKTAPVVLGVPDLIALNRPSFATRANRAHYRAFMPRSLKTAARIIAMTPQVASQVRQRVPSALVRVAMPGVESDFLKPISPAQKEAVKQKYTLPDRFLLFVGNLEPKKNLPNLLRAAELVNEMPLVMAGGIKPWPELKKLSAQVQFLGFVPRDDLPALYAACATFCFPSHCEGFGLPVLEALACGAPVVASSRVPIPGLAQVAFTPDPRFPRAIANVITAALEGDALNESGREFARQFTWERTSRETLAVFQELGAT